MPYTLFVDWMGNLRQTGYVLPTTNALLGPLASPASETTTHYQTDHHEHPEPEAQSLKTTGPLPIRMDLGGHLQGEWLIMSATTKSPTDTGLVRLNVNLNKETAAALRELADEQGISFTEAVRRAISVYKYVSDEQSQGRKIQTMDSNDKNKRELVLM